ncbi:ankyrin repeat domain-containing protein 45 [Microcaecilia unicolor]|uniref:Ankyrin repeat domain-containing protein 45 n=1 Tax=Microcaecilia unicolor TaxID=1415580 RepID=A0A6P7YHL0_9AMPH|nr:ankyrin repeat domain-containing protein 45 [Microcaecilia unicolor]
MPQTCFELCAGGRSRGLAEIVTGDGNPRHKKVLQQDLECDIVGRNPLHTACVLGHSNIIQEFAKYNVNMNEPTTRGYLPIHYAAAWGQLDALRTLVELGADIHAVNFLDEIARDIAFRYAKHDCVEFLDWAEAKHALQTFISSVQSAVTEQDKGKLHKDEKLRCLSACKAKNDWLSNVKNPTRQDLINQKQLLEDTLLPYLNKLAGHPEIVKSGKL